jgi:hypothetical protein
MEQLKYQALSKTVKYFNFRPANHIEKELKNALYSYLLRYILPGVMLFHQ